ncbi:MAG: glycosyltransferase [Phycisphaerales bacterium]|nr:glycosyltransferase [Phycisphaerales bacterium]
MAEILPQASFTLDRPVVVEVATLDARIDGTNPIPTTSDEAIAAGHGGPVRVRRWAPEENAQPRLSIDLTVIIPAYNEQARLAATLAAAIRYLCAAPFTSCLMVVDDGSNDQTVPVAEMMLRHAHQGSLRTTTLVEHGKNRGKSVAVRNGLWLASGAHRIVSDADAATPLWELDRLLAIAIERDAGLVVGSRDVTGESAAWTLKRRLSHQLFRLWVRMNRLGAVKDSQCGFKLYRADLAEQLCRPGSGLSTTEGFEFDLEHIELARKLGHRIEEVGVRWTDQPGSKVRLIRDAAAMFVGVRRLAKRLSAIQPKGTL